MRKNDEMSAVPNEEGKGGEGGKKANLAAVVVE